MAFFPHSLQSATAMEAHCIMLLTIFTVHKEQKQILCALSQNRYIAILCQIIIFLPQALDG